MEGWQGLLIFGLVVLLIAILKTIFSEKNKIYRKIKSQKNTLKKSAQPGQLARIKGKLISTGDEIHSPLNNVKCLHYKIVVHQLVSSGKSQHFKKVFEQEEKSEYLIKQDNSYAYIRTSNLKSYIKPKAYSNYGIFNKNKVDFTDYLRFNNVKLKSFLGSKNRFRFREGLLFEGSEISVLGKASFKDADQLGLPISYGRILLIEPTEDSYVYLSNDSRLNKFKNKDFNPSEYQRIS